MREGASIHSKILGLDQRRVHLKRAVYVGQDPVFAGTNALPPGGSEDATRAVLAAIKGIKKLALSGGLPEGQHGLNVVHAVAGVANKRHYMEILFPSVNQLFDIVAFQKWVVTGHHDPGHVWKF